MASRRLQITLKPDVLRWARERSGITQGDLARKMQVKLKLVSEWERSGKISVAQADKLAQCTHTPLGFLYLAEPPEEVLPIPDFRTRSDDALLRPSPNLLETVYLMQRRQMWMRDELIEYGTGPLDFIGAYGLAAPPQEVAAAMADTLHLAHGWAANEVSWSEALRKLRDCIENAGILVVFNGIVENNTHRRLDSDEFQGFALVDAYAPLVFVNSADFKAAQMFTLAHELAHLFIGEAGLSRFENFQPSAHDTEQCCNQIAAEFLVPAEELDAFWPIAQREKDPYQAIARQFKVSSLVAARRALDLKLVDQDAFFSFYRDYKESEWRNEQRQSSGGDFWSTQKWRLGPHFGAAVIRAVREGRLGYREAYNLTGLKGETFENMPEKMEIVL